jgi:hypothetical protein
MWIWTVLWTFQRYILPPYPGLKCYHKFCARWVLQMLKGSTKCKEWFRVWPFFTAILQRWQRMSQSKSSQSSRCTNIHQASQQGLNKHCLPASKLMATVFSDRKGVLMVEYMRQGTKIMSEVYCKTLRKLRRAIQNERHGMLTYSVVLLHDNVPLITAACTQALSDCQIISTGSCLTTLLTALNSLQATTMRLSTWRTAWDHSTSTQWRVNRRCQNVAKHTWSRLLWQRHTKTHSPIIHVPQFQR